MSSSIPILAGDDLAAFEAALPQRYESAVPIDSIFEFPGNPKDHDLGAIIESIEQNGLADTIRVQVSTRRIIGGHGTREALRALSWKHVPVLWIDCNDRVARKLLLAYNRASERGGFNPAALSDFLAPMAAAGDLAGTGYDDDDLAALNASLAYAGAEAPEPLDPDAAERERAQREAEQRASTTLAQRFGVPPFSVLDGRAGYWMERKRAWLSLGIESEVGRDGNLLGYSEAALKGYKKLGEQQALEASGAEAPSAEDEGGFAGTSIFDPVLCELVYRWLCPQGGAILDPFAGGSVRGLIASRLDRSYLGIDLRAEQVAANRAQWSRIGRSDDPAPRWLEGDSAHLGSLLAREYQSDLVFTCPPYLDLESYSDDPRDLSAIAASSPDAFFEEYGRIIGAACRTLREDRFAAIVVGDVRDRSGHYQNFVSRTIDAFERAGLHLYNEAIYLTPAGSAALRAARVFQPSRKLCKVHQNLLIFVKGDWRKATAAVGPVDFGGESADDPALAASSVSA